MEEKRKDENNQQINLIITKKDKLFKCRKKQCQSPLPQSAAMMPATSQN
jgi:hypothetical protein